MPCRARFLALSLSLSLALGACDSPPGANDAGSPDDAGMPDAFSAPDAHMGLLLPHCEDTDPAPTTALPHFASTLVGTYVPHVARVAMPGPLNPASEMGETTYRAAGYHLIDVGPGQPHVLRTDLGGAATTSTDRRSLAWLAHLSDFQLADDEAPTRLGRTDTAAIPGGLRAQEAYLPRAMSALNRTFARIETASRPFDGGIVTGDCSDSALTNELGWMLDVMNGVPGVETDSGDDDDPIPGPDNDPKDPFDPVAFPAPWYYVPGNHDVEIVGVTAPTTTQRMTAIGTRAATGTRDYRQWYAPITTGEVPADPMRAVIDRDGIVAMVRDASHAGPMGPAGHGFDTTAAVDTSLGANWVHDVIPGLLRVIAIDTSDRTGGSNGMVLQDTIDGFLMPELDRAVSDGVLVILASHHSMSAVDTIEGQLGSTMMPGAVDGTDVEALVAMHPEVIAWIVGHDHDNRIRAIHGPDAAHPGYWEIMTSALADWPSQARTLEIVDNADGTLSIFATLIDYDTDDCFERCYRALTQMEWTSAGADARTHDAPNHNVELIRSVPATATTAITTARATAGTVIESLTALAAP
jgi:hypothetical protein